MASVTLDFSDELLAEINRIAQQHNVTRNDVFSRAVVALARSREMEERMDRLSHLHAEAAGYKQELTTRLTAQRATMIGLGGELDALRRQLAAAAQGRRVLFRELSWLRTEVMRDRTQHEKLARERDAAVKARVRMENTLAERTYTAMNNLEVGKLRRELAALKKQGEAALVRERAATHKAERTLGRLRTELGKARKELSSVAKLLSKK